MGRIWVVGADFVEGRVNRLAVRIAGLPPRTVDRDTAVQWLRDGHSLLPATTVGTALGTLQAVDPSDDGTWYLRTDTANEAADQLAGLPGVS